MNNKQKIYCGLDEKLPDGYDKFGTRFECMRKGYGSALYNAPQEKIDKARRQKKRMDNNEIEKIANALNIPTKTDANKNRNKKFIVKDIIEKLNNLLEKID